MGYKRRMGLMSTHYRVEMRGKMEVGADLENPRRNKGRECGVQANPRAIRAG